MWDVYTTYTPMLGAADPDYFHCQYQPMPPLPLSNGVTWIPHNMETHARPRCWLDDDSDEGGDGDIVGGTIRRDDHCVQGVDGRSNDVVVSVIH